MESSSQTTQMSTTHGCQRSVSTGETRQDVDEADRTAAGDALEERHWVDIEAENCWDIPGPAFQCPSAADCTAAADPLFLERV